MMKILIVEDEKAISNFIRAGLESEGYACGQAFDGLAACDEIDENKYDLILLDVMLPGADGFEIMEYIRPKEIPVIFITAKAQVSDRVKGLKLGADDYLVKPFDLTELLTRVEVVLRRYQKGKTEFTKAGVTVNLDKRTCVKDGREIPLTAKEFDLCVFFMKNAGAALFRETIYERVWQGEYTLDSRTVDLHVMRLRKKLSWEGTLVTVNRIGYRLNA
ncbi:MAG: response regulator transcription factor [Clostridia bacterium]|nr:response regulator transcription factor [Clostridia bacterium]